MQVCALAWNRHERELLSSHGFSQNQLCLWRYPSMSKVDCHPHLTTTNVQFPMHSRQPRLWQYHALSASRFVYNACRCQTKELSFLRLFSRLTIDAWVHRSGR